MMEERTFQNRATKNDIAASLTGSGSVTSKEWEVKDHTICPRGLTD